MFKRITGLAIIALTLVGCGDAGEGGDGESMEDVEVNFSALVDGDDFSCSNEYTLGMVNTTAKITDLRFYVSDVSLIRADGQKVNVELENDGKWQNGTVALLDFEDGTGACANGNAASINPPCSPKALWRAFPTPGSTPGSPATAAG